MTTTVFLAGKPVRLEDRDLLGIGGEGRVFRAGGHAIKVFFAASDARDRKLKAFPSGLPHRVIGPRELCCDADGNVVGYAMRVLENAVDMLRLGQRKWRQASGMRAAEVLGVFGELASTVGELHARNVIVGDLNDGNVVVTPEQVPTGVAWQPFLIDADSMQFAGFPCTVAHERFLDPRLYGVDLGGTGALSRESDFYALAVMLFTSLLYVHPYGGAHPSYPTMLRRAEARHSILRGDVKLPHAASRFDVLPDDVLAWFMNVFDRDAREPLPRSLLDARFTRCACGIEHARLACPACAVRARPVAPPPPVKTLGRLRVTTMTRSEGARFVEPATDPSALVRIDGDWLVRADGTRIGQVLENQTHVSVSSHLGFAFYRAGRITMSFVFDTARGPLRQLALPHIDGRLVEWSVTFDAGHALFCTSTEKAGRVLHSAHLVDARGAIVASESGPVGSSAILYGVSGKCLAGGAILVPTDDGLVLVRADRATHTFVSVRAFPETRDLVPPDAELLVGPGGSVYVVSHDAIVHLSFEGNPSS